MPKQKRRIADTALVWAIVALIITIVLAIWTALMLDDWLGRSAIGDLVSIFLGFFVMINYYLYKFATIAGMVCSLVALGLSISPKYRNKVGVIISIITTIVISFIFLMTLLGKWDISIGMVEFKWW